MLKEIRWTRPPGVELALDPDRRDLIPLLRKTSLERIAVPPTPWGVACDGTSVWVTSYQSTTVTRIDIATRNVTPVTVGNNPMGLAFDGAHMWVANFGDGTVSKIDVANNSVAPPIEVGSGPRDVAFDGTTIWVANYYSGTAVRIDITTNQVIQTINLANKNEPGPTALALHRNRMWVANSFGGATYLIDIGTGQVAGTALGGPAFAIASDGANVWQGYGMYAQFINKCNHVGLLMATVNVDGPSGLAFDGAHLWVTNFLRSTVSKIDVNTNAVVAAVAVGSGPIGVAFDGTHLWVANSGGSTVNAFPILDLPSGGF